MKMYISEKQLWVRQHGNYVNTNRAVAAQIFSKYCMSDMKDALRDVNQFNAVVQHNPVLLMTAIRRIHYQGSTTQHPWKVYIELEQQALFPSIWMGRASMSTSVNTRLTTKSTLQELSMLPLTTTL